MADTPCPSKFEKFEIQAYEKPKDFKALKKTHVPFSGSPQRHPYDDEKILLITDPFSSNTTYYEFKNKDIDYLEELSNLVDIRGKAIAMVRIWVRKLSVGVRCAPFVIEDIQNLMTE
ncbi:MAG: inorganic pyrophosphatase Ppa [Proteobacteria bacterium]|nr:inorganic pyrophosphatase Ppa [Pseudomonadota bacterium]MBU4037307.1 inorganic pyrophosphatase Ppa [Pseudomonadota bacterium]